jgi:steroid 5-alpha reductase family enzyme
MWWGVFLVSLSTLPEMWLLGTGAVINTLLFLFISIPLAEKHLASYKTGYAEYKSQTRMLIPIPKHRNDGN